MTGTLYCIGRNYGEHARELGNPIPDEPVVFLKPASALVLDGGPIVLPARSQRVDHECEIVVQLGRGGRHLSRAEAVGAIGAYTVGIDVTARDLQDEAKKKALPWAVAKGFETFAPVGRFVPAADVRDPSALGLALEVNGQPRQKGSVAQMLWSIPELIQHLSTIFRLAPGDLVFTGTPAGVGPLRAGDQLRARLLQKDQTLAELLVAVQDEERRS